MKNVLGYIESVLKKVYPLRVDLNKVSELSHLYMIHFDPKQFSVLQFGLDGVILNGTYADYKIVKVVTTDTVDWHTYLCDYTLLLNQCWFPCINEPMFLFFVHFLNLIPSLRIQKFMVENKIETVEVEAHYEYRKEYCFPLERYIQLPVETVRTNSRFLFIKPDLSKSGFQNHFYLHDFSVMSNHKQLKAEIDRLVQGRDKYATIHFHLDDNTGGDIVAPHLILRCLTGKKESWMRPITKMTQTKEVYTWDCWQEERDDSPNYSVVQQLNLDELPQYETKYNGKIVLHMTKVNGSAAWFFITYLVYAFGGKITRFSKKCFGQTVKYGTVESDRFVLVGHSGTTSGDGNNQLIVKDGVCIKCPTEQFLKSSIQKMDWNRYWVDHRTRMNVTPNRRVHRRRSRGRP